MKAKINQCCIILNHLMKHGVLTTSAARQLYGITSMGARILELRRIGVTIHTTKKGYSLAWWVKQRKKPREDVVQLNLFQDETDT